LKNEIIELKNEIDFLKPKPANEMTSGFIENGIFDRPSFEKPYFLKKVIFDFIMSVSIKVISI